MNQIVDFYPNKTDNLEGLHELIRKELIADLIFEELYKGIQLTNNNTPDFNAYKLNEDYLLTLLKKYNQDAYENKLNELVDKKAKKAKNLEEDK